MTKPVTDLIPREPRLNRIVILEELNFIWDRPELNEMKKMWKNGDGVERMAKYFDRDPDEVILALIHLARDEKITPRKTGLKGV